MAWGLGLEKSQLGIDFKCARALTNSPAWLTLRVQNTTVATVLRPSGRACTLLCWGLPLLLILHPHGDRTFDHVESQLRCVHVPCRSTPTNPDSPATQLSISPGGLGRAEFVSWPCRGVSTLLVPCASGDENLEVSLGEVWHCVWTVKQHAVYSAYRTLLHGRQTRWVRSRDSVVPRPPDPLYFFFFCPAPTGPGSPLSFTPRIRSILLSTWLLGTAAPLSYWLTTDGFSAIFCRPRL